MAAQVSKSALMNKLKNKTKGAWQRAKNAQPKARGVGGLPGGIKDGVALLKKFKFDSTKKGDPFFMLTGIVVEPAEYTGRQASVTYFINDDPATFDNPKTAEDKLEDLSSDIQLLGGEPPDDVDSIPDVLESLCSEGRHFLFNTFLSEKQEKAGKMAKVFIQGLAEGYENDPSTEGEDEDGGDSSEESDNTGDDEQEGEAEAATNGEAEEEESEYIPQKGDAFKWRHPKLKKDIKIIVQSADADKRTVSIKTAAKVNGKIETYNKVSFDKLIGE